MSLPTNIDALYKQMQSFINTKTVVGEPIHINDVIIVPLVDVSFGMGIGQADTGADKLTAGGGGGGMGAKITPSAVIVVANGTPQLINIKNTESVNKLIDLVPAILSKLNIPIFGKKKEEDEQPNLDNLEFEGNTDTPAE